MNNEIYIAKGKLAELKNELNKIEIRADSLLIQIRELLNPANDLLEFDTELIYELVKTFRELQLQAREINEKIIKLKQSYNL